MAKVKKTVRTQSRESFKSPFTIYWTKENYILLAVGILTLILGYYLMSVGPWDSSASLVLSPIVLVVAYLVIIPLSIFYKKKKQNTETQAENVSGQS